ncbi:hypothetical protein GCM10025789_30870 [Tessaracoccus lubricantis]|uniref:Pyridoxamine 5'-phosphate oxidase putative domain-containing protein n=1 Tax=Tessaracoccus lubricantis TaxID=545543 RepID=A0ABP9FP26_9ACTN
MDASIIPSPAPQQHLFPTLTTRLRVVRVGVLSGGDTGPALVCAGPVVWVDGAVPVMDRRRDGDGRWEGLVVFVSAGEVHREWISGARISKVDQAR